MTIVPCLAAPLVHIYTTMRGHGLKTTRIPGLRCERTEEERKREKEWMEVFGWGLRGKTRSGKGRKGRKAEWVHRLLFSQWGETARDRVLGNGPGCSEANWLEAPNRKPKVSFFFRDSTSQSLAYALPSGKIFLHTRLEPFQPRHHGDCGVAKLSYVTT